MLSPSNLPDPVTAPESWSPDSWKNRRSHQFEYADAAALEAILKRIRVLPPLVTSWEIERLKQLLTAAQLGQSFVLQGGDCAERLADCGPNPITGRLKILLQMSLVLFHATRRPVIRIGRFAGQYAKPRSSPTETRPSMGGIQTLPSYFGDLVNREEFTAEARQPDPRLMMEAYLYSAATMNFVRSLVDRGFADLHHPENWNLDMLRKAGLAPELRSRYQRMCDELVAELNRADAVGAPDTIHSTRAEFFTSHEGLNLYFESAQTRQVPRREGYYNLTTHLPWIGDRTRAIGGGHVEYFRGIQNPVGVKLGPTTSGDDLLRLCEALNPGRQAGKLVLISRMGSTQVDQALPPLIARLQREGWASAASSQTPGSVLWTCDPMHGNTFAAGGGRKTRRFEDIRRELETTWEIHQGNDSRLGGAHIELTEDDVTECLGGASGVTEADLDRRYTTACDPRLNYDQAMELAFLLAEKMRSDPTRPQP